MVAVEYGRSAGARAKRDKGDGGRPVIGDRSERRGSTPGQVDELRQRPRQSGQNWRALAVVVFEDPQVIVIETGGSASVLQ